MSKKNNKTNEINWGKYNEELLKLPSSTLNEYRDDLHNMTVKDSLVRDAYLCPAYLRAMKELEDYDNIELNYLNYEKDLKFGESN